MYGAGLEVEFQTAALDKTQCDDDFLVGRESEPHLNILNSIKLK